MEQSHTIHGLQRPVAPSISEHVAQLQAQFLVATVPLTVHVAQTSQAVQQTTVIAGGALQKAQYVQEMSVNMRGDIEGILREHSSQTSTMTQQQVSAVAKTLTKKIARMAIPVEERVRVQQITELEKLRE